MKINARTLQSDLGVTKNTGRPEDFEKALQIVVEELKATPKGGKLNLQDIYTNYDVGDIDLYVAFHEMIELGFAEGISPYAVDEELGDKIHSSHTTMELSPTDKEVKTIVRLQVQDYQENQLAGKRPFEADWDLKRNVRAVYPSAFEGEAAANEAFAFFNMPEAPEFVRLNSGPSLSIGDIVETLPVDGSQAQAHICKAMGWESKPLKAKPPTPELPENKRPEPPKAEPKEMPKVTFLNEACEIEVAKYQTGPIALKLWCEEGPMATATVNLPDMKPAANHVFIKDYSENEGMAEAFEKAGIGETTRILSTGGFNSRVVEMKITHPAVLEKIAALTPSKKQKSGPEPSLS